jgi:2,4-dichlorophenol 6-monooxygenase
VRVSTHDLVGTGGGFALLTDSGGSAWCAAAEEVAARRGVRIRAVRIARAGEPGGDLVDSTGRWAAENGLGAGGALLVRPDNHVGFRGPAPVPDPGSELDTAFRAILASPARP